jgi:hypothetical protein
MDGWMDGLAVWTTSTGQLACGYDVVMKYTLKIYESRTKRVLFTDIIKLLRRIPEIDLVHHEAAASPLCSLSFSSNRIASIKGHRASNPAANGLCTMWRCDHVISQDGLETPAPWQVTYLQGHEAPIRLLAEFPDSPATMVFVDQTQYAKMHSEHCLHPLGQYSVLLAGLIEAFDVSRRVEAL